MRKNWIAITSAGLMLAMSVSAFSACKFFTKDEGQKTVMNICLNPEVEFVLDGENKVLTVNAINEEGNLIVSSEAFKDIKGKTAEEAATLFVEVSKDTGYLVQGELRSGENEVKISLSGDTGLATELYSSVETQLKNYLQNVDIQATVQKTDGITEEQLKKLVEECAPYLDSAEMEYAELVETIIESREETANFFSQEIKEAYYEAKELAMQQAEIEVLKKKLNLLEEAFFNTVNLAYKTNMVLIEAARKALVDGYQIALESMQASKIDYLKKRLEISIGGMNATVEIELNDLDKLVEQAEVALTQVVAKGQKDLDTYKGLITEQYDKAIAKFEAEKLYTERNIKQISKKRKDAEESCFKAFELVYSTAIKAADASWLVMEEALRASVKTSEEAV